MESSATFLAQCPYTASTCPLLAPFSVDYKSGSTGGPDGVPSASACASAHASPAPSAVAPERPAPSQTYSDQQHQRHQQQQHDDRPYSSGQVMLADPHNDSYEGEGDCDGSTAPAPTVPIHRPRPNLNGSAADRAHGSSSCRPGQCSTPDTCNPSPSAQAGPSSRYTLPRSGSHHQQQWAFNEEAQQQRQRQRPGLGRFASADSTFTQATADSSEYSSLGGGHGGSFDSQQAATPASSLMHSPPLQPVHLQRPVFGAPSPYQTNEYAYEDEVDGRSTYPPLSGYSFPLPSPLPDLVQPLASQDGQQQEPRQPQQQPQRAYQRPPLAQQHPAYGSYGTCDVEDLIGGRAHYAQQQVEQKPDFGPKHNTPPTLPPLFVSHAGPSAYKAPLSALPPVQPHPPAALTAIEEVSATAEAPNSGEQTAFISKLWHLLTHAEYERYLRWNKAGDAFILTNGNEFAMKVLPRFFRHSNVASFCRQLNLYQFSRLSTIRLLDMTDASTSTSIVPHEPSASDHVRHIHSETDSDTASSHSGEGAGNAGPAEGSIAASGFSHPNFLRGRPDLLKLLKPRGASKKNTANKKAIMAVNAEKAKVSRKTK